MADNLFYKKEAVQVMAESKRRSQVAKFAHKTEYPKAPLPLQPSLFEGALSNIKQEWSCHSSIPLAVGATVFVRVCAGKRPDVLLGNQVVAIITDASSDELTDAIRSSEHMGGLVATIVSCNDNCDQFIINIGLSH